MSKQASRFTLRDVARALRAVRAPGVTARIDISPAGMLSIVPIGEPNRPEPEMNADAIISKLK